MKPPETPFAIQTRCIVSAVGVAERLGGVRLAGAGAPSG